MKEFDRPYALLQRPRSQFKRMVEQTGPTASRKLYQMALVAQRRRPSFVSDPSDVAVLIETPM